MRDIFISYVEEDNRITTELAEGLEEAGYSVWYYERDGEIGGDYLLQTKNAIEQCQAFLLIISPKSVSSNQVDIEVVRAHETDKHFFPLRSNITHAEFAKLQPKWAQVLGSTITFNIPPEGASKIVPGILKGLEKQGVNPSGKLSGPLKPSAGPLKRIDPATGKLRLQTGAAPKAEEARPASRTKYYIAAAALVVIIIGALILFSLGESDAGSDLPPGATTPVREQFGNLQAWNHPPNWSVGEEMLQIGESPQVGFLTGKNFRDFTMEFQVALINGEGAAWALRVNDEGYYLFYLSGPRGMHPNKFVTYLVRGDKMDQVGTTFNFVRPLQEGGVYTISIKAEKNNFFHQIRIDEAPDKQFEGETNNLGTYSDSEDTFPSGSVGFRTFANEKFAVADLFVYPPGTKPLQ
jgi:hypothetical protein